MKNRKRLFMMGIALASIFAAIAMSAASQDFYEGLEDNFLGKSIDAVERDAQKLTVKFTEEEAEGLIQLVEEVRNILSDQSEEKLLKSDLQGKLLRMESEWKKREGAWIVVRLLEGIRIKAQLYLQNAYLLRRVMNSDGEIKLKTQARMAKYLKGIEVSTDALEDTIEAGTAHN